ncbi:hypothetical protein AK830_g4249 [Neonectria ditissima]|uniref:Aminoglycoside phosphotransferase domain-containing protein n=1 Tax=Neonectria ditissima TaxID=78410 RepID=A0A0P7BLQ2_9HYPO|nr:hypothetical protein AK830_g4249 [Neonectria ditissima]
MDHPRTADELVKLLRKAKERVEEEAQRANEAEKNRQEERRRAESEQQRTDEAEAQTQPTALSEYTTALIKRIFFIPWIYCLTRLRCLWRSHLAYTFRRAPPSPFDLRPLTDQQRKLKVDEFIDSIDTDAIRALASKYFGGLSCTIRSRRRGSFNVCFILDFPDDTTRVVRVPIEPMVHDVWDKVCSEVYTMQYVRHHTNIPIPQVYAYGRSRLRRDTSAHQVFMVLDYIDGQSLTKKLLRDSSQDCRRQLFGNVIDMFAQLRGLEFLRGGSLMPNATVGTWPRLRKLILLQEEPFMPRSTIDLESRPKIVGAFSMRKNELQIDGYTAPRSIATTAKEFFREQYQLLQYIWKLPSQALDQEEAEREEFALHVLSSEEAQNTLRLTTNSSGDSFWEFSVTVPQTAFLPPSWITGHDTGSIVSKVDFSSEFMSILLSRKQQSSSHSQLAQDWDFRDNISLPMTYIFLDPSDLTVIFYRFIYPRLYTEPRDEVVPGFFQWSENKELQVGLERRLHASERYTQYLKDNDLLDDEEPEWQGIHQWTTDAKKTLGQLGSWGDEKQKELARLDGDRAMQRGGKEQA